MEENKKVIIIKGQENKKDGPKMSFRNYGKGICKYKFWVLGFTVGTGLLSFLASMFILNPSRESMSTNIIYSLALNVDSETGIKTYFDGSSFSYTDLLSKSNIESALEYEDENGNKPFSHLSYNQLMNANAFQINAKEVTTTINGSSITKSSDTEYLITTRPKAFLSTDEARSFIKTLIECEVQRADAAIDSYSLTNYLPLTKTAFGELEYSSMVSKLEKQYAFIGEKYDELSSKFSSSFRISDKSLNDYEREYSALFSTTHFSSLKGQITNQALINIKSKNDVTTKLDEIKYIVESYKSQCNQLIAEINYNNDLLSQLKDIQQPTDDMGNYIITLTDTIAKKNDEKNQLITEIEHYGYIVEETKTSILLTEDTSNTNTIIYHLNNPTDEWVNKCINFISTLNDDYDKITKSISTTSEVFKRAYSQGNANTIELIETNGGNINGHINNYMVASIGLAIGFIASSLICAEIYINVEYNKNNEIQSQDKE